ncbi:uncharacterized protein LOC144707615 isoform X2 [Wolffia australiana]
MVPASELKGKAEESQPGVLHRSYLETARWAFSSPLSAIAGDLSWSRGTTTRARSEPYGENWVSPPPGREGFWPSRWRRGPSPAVRYGDARAPKSPREDGTSSRPAPPTARRARKPQSPQRGCCSVEATFSSMCRWN